MSSATVNALLACCAISMREPAAPKHTDAPAKKQMSFILPESIAVIPFL